MTPGGTIAALASAAGHAERAIIRIAGELEPIERLIDPMPRERSASRVQLDLDGSKLPCFAIRYVAPASYTGEDAIELLVPGSPAVVERVLAVLMAQPGVRAAEPGEFSARAFLAGKLTIDRALGVEATIAAASAQQLAAAHDLLSGSFGDAARGWTEAVAGALALVEAGIDFADQEDVTAIEPAALRGAISPVLEAIGGHLGSSGGRERGSALPRVALVGPPSAGKSTLFNALLGRSRTVTDAEPGTTRDAIAEPLELEPGVSIELVDLPGLDAAPGDAFQRSAAEEAERADVRVLCDEHGDFPAAAEPFVRVRTKADRPGRSDNESSIAVCAMTGEGLSELRLAIRDRLGSTAQASGLPASVAGALAGAQAALSRVDGLAASHQPPAEMVAGELRAALDALGVITGRVDPDTVLGLVFSRFCVGK